MNYSLLDVYVTYGDLMENVTAIISQKVCCLTDVFLEGNTLLR